MFRSILTIFGKKSAASRSAPSAIWISITGRATRKLECGKTATTVNRRVLRHDNNGKLFLQRSSKWLPFPALASDAITAELTMYESGKVIASATAGGREWGFIEQYGLETFLSDATQERGFQPGINRLWTQHTAARAA